MKAQYGWFTDIREAVHRRPEGQTEWNSDIASRCRQLRVKENVPNSKWGDSFSIAKDIDCATSIGVETTSVEMRRDKNLN